MSTNARPDEHPLLDDTLRRSGVRDLSGDNDDGKLLPLPNPSSDIEEPYVGGRPQIAFPDWMLHAGPPPGRIDRLNELRVFGLTGKNQFGKHERHGETMRVSHVPASHPNKPITAIQGIAVADDAAIPTPRIGVVT